VRQWAARALGEIGNPHAGSGFPGAPAGGQGIRKDWGTCRRAAHCCLEG
jgi:hypothetical protein